MSHTSQSFPEPTDVGLLHKYQFKEFKYGFDDKFNSPYKDENDNERDRLIREKEQHIY